MTEVQAHPPKRDATEEHNVHAKSMPGAFLSEEVLRRAGLGRARGGPFGAAVRAEINSPPGWCDRPIWVLRNQRLREGLWLVTETALMQGVRTESGYKFSAVQTASGLLGMIFSPTGLDQRINFLGQRVASPGELMTRLRRASLYWIACAVRDEIEAGISGEIPQASHRPAATEIFQATVRLEASVKNEVRAAVTAKLRDVLREELGEGFAILLINGAVHRVPRPDFRLVLRPLRSRPRPEPVLLSEEDVSSVGWDLDGLLRRLDVASERVIHSWQEQADHRQRQQLDKVEAYLADADTETDWRGSEATVFYERNHYRISLTENCVKVEKQNRQPWYIETSKGQRYCFPGTHLELTISALGEIPGVRVIQPTVHRYIGARGQMCLPAAVTLIPTWLKNPSLRLGQVVARIFALYEHSIRATSVLHGNNDAKALARFEPFRVADGAQLPPDAVFYSGSDRAVTHADPLHGRQRQTRRLLHGF